MAQLIQDADAVAEAQQAWGSFLNLHSDEVASDYVLGALGTPTVDFCFKIPRSLLAMRFMNDLKIMVNTIQHPGILLKIVQRHRSNDFYIQCVTPQFANFQIRMILLLAKELGDDFTEKARRVWWNMLSYIGNALKPDLGLGEYLSLPTLLPTSVERSITRDNDLQVFTLPPPKKHWETLN